MEQAPAKKAKLIVQLRALNEQFAEWIQDQLVNHREDVWLEGVEDYIEHAKNLLTEAADSDSPVSGLTDDRAQAWMNGQRAEAHAQHAHDAKLQGPGSASSADGKASELPGLRFSSTEPHQSSSATASGRFAFPSFNMPTGLAGACKKVAQYRADWLTGCCNPVSIAETVSQYDIVVAGDSATAAASAVPLSCVAPVLSGSSQQQPSAATSQAALMPPLFSGAASTAPAPVAFGWGSSSSSTQSFAAESPPQPSGGLFSSPGSAGAAAPFSFGAGALSAPSASGASAAATPSFSAFSTPAGSSSLFGQVTGPSATSGDILSFHASSASTANTGAKPLDISWATNGAGSAKGSGAADEAGDGEAAEEDEPKAELQLGDDSTLLFKEPAKLYFQGKDGGWDDRGKGTLTVRQSKGSNDGTAGLTNIVFTMESGRIIVNGSVYKGLKTQKLKNPKMICMNLTLAVDSNAQKADPTPQTVMFNTGLVEKSERFCTIVEQSIPK